MQSNFSQNAVKMQPKSSQNAAKIQSLLGVLIDWKGFSLVFKSINFSQYSQRGFDMEAYVTQQVENYTVDGSRNMTIAVYLSSSLLEVEGDHQIEYRVPTKVMRYPTGVSQ